MDWQCSIAHSFHEWVLKCGILLCVVTCYSHLQSRSRRSTDNCCDTRRCSAEVYSTGTNLCGRSSADWRAN